MWPHGATRAQRDAHLNIEHYVEIARTAERAKFDFVFNADTQATFGPDDIHRVTHLEGEPAITIHAYSPELRRMGSYIEGPGGVLMRRAQDEDEELRPLAVV